MINISISFYDWCIENKPALLKEWDYEENDKLGITPHNITHGSGKIVWWCCENNHRWQTQMVARTKGNLNCPYCSNQKVLAGYNDLATIHPEVAKEWHPTKNENLNPTDVMAGSGKKVWWICKKGHEYKQTIFVKTKGYGCPYCTNKKILQGYNDLATTHPHLVKEWHPAKNGNLTPYNVFAGSNKRVWWRCENGHEWEASPNNRSKNNATGCPYCSNQKVLAGYNDLATTHPEVAKEWHPTKNGDLKPTDITAGSHKKVWWKCKKGHEWSAKVYGRTSGSGCKQCSLAGISKREKLFLFYLSKYANENIKHKYTKFGFEIDIYIPSLKIGIEYDGSHFHEDTEKDIIKNKKCIENGIKLFRIREKPLKPLNDTSIDICYNYYNKKALEKILKNLIKLIFLKNVDIDLKKDSVVLNTYINSYKNENPLTTTHPEIAQQWHPIKNGTLKPEDFTHGTDVLMWWQCEKGHEWQATIHNRTSGRNCPYCANKKVLIHYNDLSTTHPHLAKQWHPTKNGDIKPTDIMAGTHKKFWWIDESGNEKYTSANNMVQRYKKHKSSKPTP